MEIVSIIVRDDALKHFVAHVISPDKVIELDDETFKVAPEISAKAQVQFIFTKPTDVTQATTASVTPDITETISSSRITDVMNKHNKPTLLGEGANGRVTACLIDGKKGFCIKSSTIPGTDMGLECAIGQKLSHVDRCVHVVGKRVDLDGKCDGIVMNAFSTTLEHYISKLYKMTQLQDNWRVVFLVWLADESVRGVLAAHRLGIVLGDMKMGNAGLIANWQFSGVKSNTCPWRQYLLQLCDFGGSGIGINFGSFMHRPGDFSSRPAAQLLEQNVPHDAKELFGPRDVTTLRRNDWFQCTMTIYDAAYRVSGTYMNKQEYWGIDKKNKDIEIGTDWADALPDTRALGWLTFLTNHPRHLMRAPEEVRALLLDKSFHNIDKQLTRNFQTSE